MRTGFSRFSSARGFSLLELSIVLTIIALIVAGGLTVSAVRITQAEQKQTYDRLQTIQTALKAFAKRNQYLPCPASLSAKPGNPSAQYGKEMRATNTTCTVGANLAYSITSNGTGGGTMYVGAVPFYTLGLQDTYLGDAWNGRIAYAVSANIIKNNATLPLSGTPLEGQINIYDTAGATITTSPVLASYVLLSHGASGIGSYISESGAANSNTCASGTKDYANCRYPSLSTTYQFTDAPYNNNSASASFFDDIIVWGTSTILMN